MPRLALALIASIVLSIIGYIAVVAWSGSEETLAAMRQLSAPAWAAVLALSLGNYLTRFARWQRYLARLGADSLPPPGTHALIYTAGFALTTTPGKAGETVRGVILKRYYQVPFALSLSAFFVERLMDLVSVLVIVVLAVPVAIGSDLRGIAVLLVIAALALLPLLHNRTLLAWLKRRVRRWPHRPRVVGLHVLALFTSSAALLQNRSLYEGLALGLLAWTLEGIGLYLILQGMGVDIALTVAIGIYGLSTLVGALTLVPGGLGGTEISMVALLVAAGADQATAAGATLICRIASLWFAVLLGMLAPTWLALGGLPQAAPDSTPP